jgi:RimJ/RimL family protein N-acetyltransferase
MKQNYEICLVGPKTTLLPYRPEHVEKYHDWMKDEELLQATDSEPLSLDEEIVMQKSWRDDPMKCTFIVHASEACQLDDSEVSVTENIGAMVGDVNLFLSDIEPDEDEHDNTGNDDEKPLIQAEIDIMIAEMTYKRRGLGKSATCAMLLYGANELKVYRFFCKINEDNIASVKLFEGLGFVQCNYAACFKQVELELIKPLAELNGILKAHGDYRILKCPNKGTTES